jgi:uncharacterized protein (DUF1501 family)
MKRRKFIQSSSLMTLPIVLNGMEVTAVSKSRLEDVITGDDDRVLVLVQMNGGNDGLNMVIPLDQYSNLSVARPTLIMPEASVLKLSTKTGLNPGMGAMSEMFKEGKLSLVHSVSYPNQNRSHFRSTDIWTSASDSDKFISTGWLGRYFDLKHSSFPDNYPNTQNPDPFAITIGSIVSETCQGTTSNYSFAATSGAAMAPIPTTVIGPSENSCAFSETTFVRDMARQTNEYSSQVSKSFGAAKNKVTYPTSNLANQLKLVANLIAGGLKTKIYVVSIGGFDTHANQVVVDAPTTGTHYNLLNQLSEGIAAFQKDLRALGIDQRVLGMTFSEFGRRIKSNNSYGTDHGTAAPVFLFGSCVSGNIIGNNPTISSSVGNDEGVQMQYDFRSIYATIMQDWFKVPKADIQRVLFKEFTYVPFIKDCSITPTEEELLAESKINIYPNPAVDYIQLDIFSPESSLDIEIYNLQGFVLKEYNRVLVNDGVINMTVEVNELPTGHYFIRVHGKRYSDTQRFTKI